MTHILSYGGGVNSTAIIALALLGELPMPDYIVFSDTGAEWPHTYKYLNYIEKQGIKLVYLTGGMRGEYIGMTLIEWCREKSFIPSRMNRWCTDYWKRTPVRKFTKAFNEAEVWIGIDAGEAHRAEGKRHAKFPLVELGINRNQCREIIKKSGLGIPRKSGCFICPYQAKRQWTELKRDYPELWKIAVELEHNSIFHKNNFTYKGIPIEKYVADLDKQEELDFGIILDQKCACYFD